MKINISANMVNSLETENPNAKLAESSVKENSQVENVSADLKKKEAEIEVKTVSENAEVVKEQDTNIKEQEVIRNETIVQEKSFKNNVSNLWIGAIVFCVFFIVCVVIFMRMKAKKKTRGKKENCNINYSETKNNVVKIMGVGEMCSVKIASIHDVGKRSTQQDSFGISDIETAGDFEKKGVLAVVADGMGGLSAGDRVSQLAVVTMLRGFDEDNGVMPSPSLLLKLVCDANSEVNTELGEEKIGKSGTTLTAIIVKDKKLSWISVGDSHIYVWRNEKMIKLNHDHNYAAELNEKVNQGEMTIEEAMNNPQREALTSYIGMGKLDLVDQNETLISLENADRILLMSDGVFGTVSEMRIAEIMKQPLFYACEQLALEIQQKNKKNQDNYTCVVVEVD